MEAKQLRQIAKELRAASAMHKGQAVKIDRHIKAMQKMSKKK